jgi:hypothetical protein
MGGGELNCGQDTPFSSVCQSGSGPTVPAGAGRYSAVLNGIRPGACGGWASDLRCLPGAAGTTRPPTECWDTRAGRWSRAGRDRVNSSPAWHTRPFGHAWDEDDPGLEGREALGGVRPGTAHLKGAQPLERAAERLSRRWLACRRTMVRGAAKAGGPVAARSRRHLVHRVVKPAVQGDVERRLRDRVSSDDLVPPALTGLGRAVEIGDAPHRQVPGLALGQARPDVAKVLPELRGGRLEPVGVGVTDLPDADGLVAGMRPAGDPIRLSRLSRRTGVKEKPLRKSWGRLNRPSASRGSRSRCPTWTGRPRTGGP